MSDNKFRGRNFKFLLYPDDSTHCSALSYIMENFNYIGILHDKDIDVDGELKKPHWHILVCFPNDRWNTKVAKDLGITPNYMRKCEDKIIFARYLIHLDDTDKFQYPISELFGNIIDKFDFTPDGTGEDKKVLFMIDLLEEECAKVNEFNYVKAVKLICGNGLYSTLRRSGSIGNSLIMHFVNESIRKGRDNYG